MVVNRVGDVAIAIAMLVLYITFGSLEFSTIFSIVPYIHETATIMIFGHGIHTMTVIGILILIGAAGKSAQVGLHI
jgi:NADH-quinone oxidoreductase subunit L